MAAAAEVTMICLDNSIWMHDHPKCRAHCRAQLEAVKYYCETKFKCNPDNCVGLFKMASFRYGSKLHPTSDLQKILLYLKGIHAYCIGQTEFSDALADTSAYLFDHFRNMKRRLLVFVGSPIHMHNDQVKPLGSILKMRDTALDVVNFFVLGEDTSRVDYSILHGDYRYARKELGELVTVVNDNDNSHIVDLDEESSVCKILSKTILKKNVRYLRKKDQKKAKQNVNVKQEPEPSCNEKNKAAAQYGKVRETPKSENWRYSSSTSPSSGPSGGRMYTQAEVDRMMAKSERRLSQKISNIVSSLASHNIHVQFEQVEESKSEDEEDSE